MHHIYSVKSQVILPANGESAVGACISSIRLSANNNASCYCIYLYKVVLHLTLLVSNAAGLTSAIQ